MFSNYIRVAIRNLWKNKLVSLICIGGLVVGMSSMIVIMLYVQSELNFDTFHNDSCNIYRIAWISDNPQTRTPHPMAQTMIKDFPEVKQAVSLSPIYGPGLSRPEFPVRYRDKLFQESGFYSADTTFFKVFTFPFVEGNSETALKIPNGVVITETIAKKYFENEDPIDKVIYLQADQELPLTVTGVIKDIPQNSHFHFDFLISYITLKPHETGEYFEWADFGHFNYVVLDNYTNPDEVEAKMPAWFLQYNNWSEGGRQALLEGRNRFELQPITSIHLHSHLRWELEANSNINTLYIFIISAFFILIAACINYMNLSTARLSSRTIEIGIRKVIGAQRFDLFFQFMGESFIISLMAVFISYYVSMAALPFFNQFSMIKLEYETLNQSRILLGMLLLTLFVALFSGSYPAFILSSFHPIAVLKGKLGSGLKNVSFRRIMVIVQFSISIALIVGISIVFNQLNFLKNQNLGFNIDQIVVIPMQGTEIRSQSESLKSELLQHPSILSASAVSNVPGMPFDQNPIQWPSEETTVDVSEIRVDYDFFKTLDISFVEGRAFSREYTTDSGQNFILNEAASRRFTWQSAVDQEIIWYDDEVTRRGKIVGIVKDFHFQSLHNTIEPLIFYVSPEDFGYLLVKMHTSDISQTLAFVEKKWKQFNPEHSFEYSFLDEDFNILYQAEEQMQKILGYFTLLAILIACLGLYALIIFTTQQRFKEIGIRKSLGSSVSQIVFLLSKEFIQWVLLSNIIAWPLAWYVMNIWLQNFAYHIHMTIGPFILAGLLVLIIAVITMSWQAIRAAMVNPIEALKYE